MYRALPVYRRRLVLDDLAAYVSPATGCRVVAFDRPPYGLSQRPLSWGDDPDVRSRPWGAWGRWVGGDMGEEPGARRRLHDPIPHHPLHPTSLLHHPAPPAGAPARGCGRGLGCAACIVRRPTPTPTQLARALGEGCCSGWARAGGRWWWATRPGRPSQWRWRSGACTHTSLASWTSRCLLD